MLRRTCQSTDRRIESGEYKRVPIGAIASAIPAPLRGVAAVFPPAQRLGDRRVPDRVVREHEFALANGLGPKEVSHGVGVVDAVDRVGHVVPRVRHRTIRIAVAKRHRAGSAVAVGRSAAPMAPSGAKTPRRDCPVAAARNHLAAAASS